MFSPLPALPAAGAGAAAGQACYRHLIQLRGRGARISCWRHYGHGIRWQRRCGPMALACFLRHFSGDGDGYLAGMSGSFQDSYRIRIQTPP